MSVQWKILTIIFFCEEPALYNHQTSSQSEDVKERLSIIAKHGAYDDECKVELAQLGLQFDVLLDQGLITVDFLLCRDSGGDTYSFKIKGKARRLLFPESETYNLRVNK